MSVAGSDYEHWPEDSKYLSETGSVAAPGYSSYNGLYSHVYEPVADKPKEKEAPKEPEKPKECACAPPPPPPAVQPQVLQPPPYMSCYPTPPMQMPYGAYGGYGCPPGMQMACPAPAYYGYPGGYPYQMPGCAPTGYMCYPSPLAPAEEEKPKKEEKPKELEPRKWQGRTKAEVQEDNMKVAAREGAYDARKVQPVGLKEEQMVWCVEVDGSQTLR